MKKMLLGTCMIFISIHAWCWGFFGHRHINYHAVFLLPPEMLIFYKQNIGFITEHAVDPDKRRYAVNAEGPRHYIDLDHYGKAPYADLPRKWKDAVDRFSEDSLNQHGIGPWWVQVMMARLTNAFRAQETSKILRLSAEIGHYLADLHVPLHACSNHNGQHTNQQGIHGFWESRIPELLAEKQWDFFIGHAAYINDPLNYIWDRVVESGAAADTVLRLERALSNRFPPDQKYAYEERNGVIIRQYSFRYSFAYNEALNNMVERRMKMAICAVACFWYTAWANAGQPSLKALSGPALNEADQKEFAEMNLSWQKGTAKGKSCD
ncbi:MAG TPA: zinc dependent phospholipase C family protein [Flavitalea sp.]|nr:zinc dependent phospholipase C family protein [Flavitalea sp.]